MLVHRYISTLIQQYINTTARQCVNTTIIHSINQTFNFNNMNISEAKNIDLAEYLQSIGITPCKKQGNSLWYYSPFRNETEPSFKLNLALNQWYDFGLGKGGNIINFILEQNQTDNVSQALQILSCNAPAIKPYSFSFRQQENLPCFEDIRVKPLENPALLQYLKDRQIHVVSAMKTCKEVHFRTNDKAYFAIGFENNLGGFELRNKYFQGTLSPKGITHLQKGKDTCCIFEGFMDYLSFLTIAQKQSPSPGSIHEQDYIILNSVANVSKAMSVIKNYKEKYCYLDNDKAGVSAFREIQEKCGQNVKDMSATYQEYNDLNDYLCQKKKTLDLPQKLKQPGLKR